MSDEPVTLEQVKTHLRLSLTEISEDSYLMLLVQAARRSVENYIDRKIVAVPPGIEADDLRVAGQAILLLVGAWYENREAVGGGNATAEMPMAVNYLLTPLRRLAC